MYCIANKLIIDNFLKKDLEKQHITARRYLTTPTPLNNLLWFVIADNDSGYYLGYRSLLDKSSSITFHFDSRSDSLLLKAPDKKNLARLLRFSQGYYTAQEWHDTLVFNDLRFGEMRGWEMPEPRFVCHYYLQYPAANEMIVQRGRFAGWDRQAVGTFVNRILGN